jgi:hypothetical protein
MGKGGDDDEFVEIFASVERVEPPEVCLDPLRLRFEREKEAVRLESMPIVRDLGIRGGAWLRVGEMGPRSRRVFGCMFYVDVNSL